MIAEEIKEFRDYFETAGRDISASPDIVPYFALPFIQKPKEHPLFAKLFTKEWVESIKRKLIKVLHHFLPRNSPPLLLGLLKSNAEQAAPNDEIAILKSKLLESEQRYSALNDIEKNTKSLLMQSQCRWTSLANDIVTMCHSFISLIETQKKGGKMDEIQFAEMKSKAAKYKEFVYQYQQDITEPQGDKEKKPALHETLEDQYASPLNYNKIREFLISTGNDVKICSILEALRRRITKSKHGLPRKHVLHSFVTNDFLGCLNSETTLINVLLKNRKYDFI